MMNNKIISSWVRQARHRAKKYDIYTDLIINDVHEIAVYYNHTCVYCNNAATTFDCPFLLKPNAPNVQANVLPICKKCKDIKKNNDLVWMFTNGYLPEERYLSLLKELVGRRGGSFIKECIRLATGIDVGH